MDVSIAKEVIQDCLNGLPLVYIIIKAVLDHEDVDDKHGDEEQEDHV